MTAALTFPVTAKIYQFVDCLLEDLNQESFFFSMSPRIGPSMSWKPSRCSPVTEIGMEELVYLSCELQVTYLQPL